MDPSRSPERHSGGRTRKTSLNQRVGGGGGGSGNYTGAGASSSAVRSAVGTAGRVYAGGATSSSSHHVSTTMSTSSRRAFISGDDRLIVDIGARVTKAGQSGEARPRDVTWSLRLATSVERPVDMLCAGLLWTLDIARCRDDAERRVVEYKLKARLTRFLRTLFYNVLSQDPRQRKVVIVENTFMPTIVKEALRNLLFGNLHAASVSFVPSHVMSSIAIGRPCTMVLDIGYEQATLVPVYLWRPMMPLCLFTSSRVSAKRLSRRLRALLLHYGTYYAVPAATAPAHITASTSFSIMREAVIPTSVKRRIPPELLDEDFLDQIKAKALLVGPPLERAQSSWCHREGRRAASSGASDWHTLPQYIEPEEESDAMWMDELRASYDRHSEAKDMVVQVPIQRAVPLAPAAQPATLGNASIVPPPRQSRGSIVVPGWIRERAVEVLFEQGDDDGPSVTEMLLDALLKLPVDLRSTMAQNIYIVGGTAMLPGLAHRVRLELVRTLSEANEHAEDRKMPIALTQPVVGEREIKLRAMAKEAVEELVVLAATIDDSFVSARGDDSFTTTDEGETEAVEKPIAKSPVRPRGRLPYTKYTPLRSLLRHIAVLNDHAPRLNVDGKALSGAAPSFPVNISPWIGASLIGSLRIDALDQMMREEWEESHERARREGEASQRGKPAAGNRPSLGLGRGSFLGAVGGLDLGSYGPLSMGARGKFSSNAAGNPRSPSTPSS